VKLFLSRCCYVGGGERAVLQCHRPLSQELVAKGGVQTREVCIPVPPEEEDDDEEWPSEAAAASESCAPGQYVTPPARGNYGAILGT